MLHNKTDWKKQLANHPAMKAKDYNCLPTIIYMINLLSARDARPPHGRRGWYWEEVVYSSFQPLDFVPLYQGSLLWLAPRAHLVLPVVW